MKRTIEIDDTLYHSGGFMSSEVDRALFEMLTEETGTHMCDSGGTSGRHWQHNQGKSLQDWIDAPAVTAEIYGKGNSDSDVSYTINVFHYLRSQLDFDDVCYTFNEVNWAADNWAADANVYGVSREAWECLQDVAERQGTPIENLRTWNTYNGESNLSQVLQGTNFAMGDDYYVLIQIHQGADVRGGYTGSRLFRLNNDCCYDDGMLDSEAVYGTIDGKEVENTYNGYSLTTETGEPVPVTTESKVELYGHWGD